MKEALLNIGSEVLSSPINIGLLTICGVLIYKIFFQKRTAEDSPPPPPPLPPMKKQDFTLQQIREYDGSRDDGRILMAVNGNVFDVTKGKRFYGKDGPYGVLAGRDASRGLATFSLAEEVLKDEYDDLSDLNREEMDLVKEWEMQFTEKYQLVGKLLRPGEHPTDYSDAEEDCGDKAQEEKKVD